MFHKHFIMCIMSQVYSQCPHTCESERMFRFQWDHTGPELWECTPRVHFTEREVMQPHWTSSVPHPQSGGPGRYLVVKWVPSYLCSHYFFDSDIGTVRSVCERNILNICIRAFSFANEDYYSLQCREHIPRCLQLSSKSKLRKVLIFTYPLMNIYIKK